MAGPELAVGEQLDLSIGAVAHGGHCVARVGDDPDSQVVFVRHALPGERVRAVITELHPSYARADAVEIIRPSPDRVPPPCPHAGPARCGGCDWQHASGAAQRELKARVVREQFQRVAGMDVTALLREVEELPAAYRVGEPARRMPLTRLATSDFAGIGHTTSSRWTPARSAWPASVITRRCAVPGPATTRSPQRRAATGRRPCSVSVSLRVRRAGGAVPTVIDVLEGPARLHHHVGGHDFEVDAGGFWQVHPGAASALVAAILSGLRPQPGTSSSTCMPARGCSRC